MDDIRIATTPFQTPLLVDAGEHRLTVQKPGYISRTERLVLAGRDDHTLRIELTESAATALLNKQRTTPIPMPRIQRTPEQAPSGSTRATLLYAGAASSGLLAIGWAITGYVGISAAGDLHDELQHPSTESRLSSLKQRARGFLLTSDILGACAIGLGATTVYFALTPSEHKNKQLGSNRLRLGVSPGAVLIHGTFR
jgi:hypothetical protein